CQIQRALFLLSIQNLFILFDKVKLWIPTVYKPMGPTDQALLAPPKPPTALVTPTHPNLPHREQLPTRRFSPKMRNITNRMETGTSKLKITRKPSKSTPRRLNWSH